MQTYMEDQVEQQNPVISYTSTSKNKQICASSLKKFASSSIEDSSLSLFFHSLGQCFFSCPSELLLQLFSFFDFVLPMPIFFSHHHGVSVIFSMKILVCFSSFNQKVNIFCTNGIHPAQMCSFHLSIYLYNLQFIYFLSIHLPSIYISSRPLSSSFLFLSFLNLFYYMTIFLSLPSLPVFLFFLYLSDFRYISPFSLTGLVPSCLLL